jgi:hypothetical protein
MPEWRLARRIRPPLAGWILRLNGWPSGNRSRLIQGRIQVSQLAGAAGERTGRGRKLARYRPHRRLAGGSGRSGMRGLGLSGPGTVLSLRRAPGRSGCYPGGCARTAGAVPAAARQDPPASAPSPRRGPSPASYALSWRRPQRNSHHGTGKHVLRFPEFISRARNPRRPPATMDPAAGVICDYRSGESPPDAAFRTGSIHETKAASPSECTRHGGLDPAKLRGAHSL